MIPPTGMLTSCSQIQNMLDITPAHLRFLNTKFYNSHVSKSHRTKTVKLLKKMVTILERPFTHRLIKACRGLVALV